MPHVRSEDDFPDHSSFSAFSPCEKRSDRL
jgi:hypothetical protein